MNPPRRRDEARLVREFIAEAEEILERAGESLAAFEASGEDVHPEVVNAFFRSIHSLKGLSAMVGLTGFSDAAHAFEALLDSVRMGRVPLDGRTSAAAASGLAALGDLVRRIARGEADPGAGEPAMAALREAAASRRSDGEGTARTATEEIVLPPELDRVLTDYERHRLLDSVRRGRQILLLPLRLPLESFDEGLRRGMSEAGAIGELVGTFPGPPVDGESMSFLLVVAAPPESDPAEVAARCGAESHEKIGTAAAPQSAPGSEAAPRAPAALDDVLPQLGGTVRVPLERIAHLLDLTGELAIARNALKRALEKTLPSAPDRNLRHELQRAFAHLDRTLVGLTRAALATRLVPVDHIATRLGRAVRSIAASLGKEVELEVVGGETELDKVLADELQDPLLHLLRNAIGHGIESPDERLRAGKPAAGRITFSAEARGRDVAIALADDGRGIDPELVLKRARENGTLRPDDRDPDEPLEVIFAPGFSTAESVSQLSGRGVGLDVVRSRIAALKGVVSVRSTPGVGTSFEVLLPITLAVVESLLVRDGGSYFAFPTSSVVRTVGLEPGRVSRGATGVELFSDDDGPLQLAPLAALLGIDPGDAGARRTVVVAERGSQRAGFVVSSVEGLLDLIVKPLPDAIARAAEITGAAELPDGELALTLDAGMLVGRVHARDPRANASAPRSENWRANAHPPRSEHLS